MSGLLIALGLFVSIIVMVKLAIWGRRRSKGAVMAGALFSIFAPDPELEKNIRLAEQSKQLQCEEDEEGEDKGTAGTA